MTTGLLGCFIRQKTQEEEQESSTSEAESPSTRPIYRMKRAQLIEDLEAAGETGLEHMMVPELRDKLKRGAGKGCPSEAIGRRWQGHP